jgi:small subunit ribosomal protein S6e
VLNLIIVKKGEKDIEGITDVSFPRRLGPKRASKIRKMFHLEKGADVRKYVVRRIIPTKKVGGKDTYKAPKIQRLITPARLQRKRRVRAIQKQRREKARVESAEFAELLRKRRQDLAEKRRVLHSRKTVKA